MKTQKEWKKQLGGPGIIKIYNFPYYTIAVSHKYGSCGIHYNIDVPNEYEKEAEAKAKQLLNNETKKNTH